MRLLSRLPKWQGMTTGEEGISLGSDNGLHKSNDHSLNKRSNFSSEMWLLVEGKPTRPHIERDPNQTAKAAIHSRKGDPLYHKWHSF